MTQNKHNKLKPGLVASHNNRPGNGAGLFQKVSNVKKWIRRK